MSVANPNNTLLVDVLEPFSLWAAWLANVGTILPAQAKAKREWQTFRPKKL